MASLFGIDGDLRVVDDTNVSGDKVIVGAHRRHDLTHRTVDDGIRDQTSSGSIEITVHGGPRDRSSLDHRHVHPSSIIQVKSTPSRATGLHAALLRDDCRERLGDINIDLVEAYDFYVTLTGPDQHDDMMMRRAILQAAAMHLKSHHPFLRVGLILMLMLKLICLHCQGFGSFPATTSAS